LTKHPEVEAGALQLMIGLALAVQCQSLSSS